MAIFQRLCYNKGMDETKIRINKYLAMNGVCSRREADRLLSEGKVTVNGRIAKLGEEVCGHDCVKVGNRKVEPAAKKVVLAFFKPKGVTCSEKDPHAEKLIMDMISYPIRVTYAGRLDKESEGLLLLSNDGDLIQAMMKGSHGHEKEYQVRVDREITDDFLKKMGAGVYLKELEVTTRPCKIEKTGKYTFQIILTQGLNRQIRRMCRTFGYEVRELKRIRIMNITLKGLKPGTYRELTEEEQNRLYADCGLKEK